MCAFDVIAILVCPVDHHALTREETVLSCPACGRRYPIVDGIPDMVPDDKVPAAEPVDSA